LRSIEALKPKRFLTPLSFRKEGLASQNREGRPDFRAWLEGKIAYVAMIRPAIGAKLKAQLRDIL